MAEGQRNTPASLTVNSREPQFRIGATEWTAAILLIIGYFKPKAGILGGIILVGMFFTTSSMLITTPDDTIVVHGMH